MFPEVESAVCEAIRLRARLLPYLYSAFARYHTEGIPPFRSLFMDYGIFLNTRKQTQGALDDTENPYQEVAGTDIKDQFIVGDTLMAAPIAPEATSRKIIFPPGKWYDFHTGKLVASQGGVQEIECPPQAPLPLFAPDGAVIPILENNEIVVKKYGSKPGSFMLYDDDGTTFDYERGAGNWQVIGP